MASDSLHRINKELDSLSNPARQALNAITRTILEQSTKSYFKVIRTRKYNSTSGASESTLSFILDQTPTINLSDPVGNALAEFSTIRVGDSVSGDGIPEGSIITVKNNNSLVLNTATTLSGTYDITITPSDSNLDEISSIRGAEDVELRMDRWMLKKLHIFFKEWSENGYSVQSFDDLIIKDNYNSEVNTKLPFGKEPIMGQSIDGSVKTYTTPATRSLVMLSKIIYGDFDNLTEYDTFGEQVNYSIDTGPDGKSVEDFEISDDLSIYSGNFVNSNVAYWLHKIRNSQNNWIHSHSSPSPVNIKTPIFNDRLGVDDFDGNVPYELPYNFYKNDHFGYYGDSISREMAGYSLDIYTPHLEIGYKNRAEGDNSVAMGNKTISAAANSASFNCSTQAIDINSVAFGKNTISGDIPYSFLNASADGTLDIEVSCNSDCEEVITIAGQDTELDGLDLTISINTILEYSQGDKVLLYNALDQYGNRRSESIVATIMNPPATVDKNDGTGKKTLVQLSYDTDVVGSFRSGSISRLNQGPGNKSKFVIGKNNYPNINSIFQIGDERFDDIKTNSLEVGFLNGNYSERYFKFGKYTNDPNSSLESVTNLYVSPKSGLLSIGGFDKNLISVNDNVSTIGGYLTNSGTIQLFDSVGDGTHTDKLLLTSADENITVQFTDNEFRLEYPDLIAYFMSNDAYVLSSLSSATNIDFTNNDEMELRVDGDRLRIRANESISLSSRFMTIQVTNLNVTSNILIMDSDEYSLSIRDEFLLNASNGYKITDGTLYLSPDEMSINKDFPTAFSINPKNGLSHYNLLSRDRNDSQIDNSGIGSPSISTTGFHVYHSSDANNSLELFGTIDNENYVLNTLGNLVPDTDISNIVNFTIMNHHKDDWKWIMSRSIEQDGRVWTTTKSDGQWEEWRAFTYQDDIENLGIQSNYKYRAISLNSAGDKFGYWQKGSRFRVSPVSDIVDSANDTLADLTVSDNLNFFGLISGQTISNEYLSFSKIGNTVFFRLSLVIKGDFRNGIFVVFNEQYSEITTRRTAEGMNKLNVFYENTGSNYTLLGNRRTSAKYMLTVSKFINDGTTFLITSVDGAVNEASERRIEFVGQYFSDNADKLL